MPDRAGSHAFLEIHERIARIAIDADNEGKRIVVESCDLAVVGVGLSGARVLIELANGLGPGAGSAPHPLRIVAFDKAGEFARGVAYGARSDRRALLIETLGQTRCPEFASWLQAQPQALQRLCDSQELDDRVWWVRNKAAIAARCYEHLYLPRHLFGEFSACAFAQAIDRAIRRDVMRLRLCTEEVTELHRLPSGSYRVVTPTGEVESRMVLLAVGSIPRQDQFWPRPESSFAHKYLKDDAFCGSFRLRHAFDRFVRREPDGPIRLAIIGGAASAIESLYCAMDHRLLSERIVSAVTVSLSGTLPGGIRSADAPQCPVSDYVSHRTSADVYLRTALELMQRNRLRILAAQVKSVRPHENALRLDILQQSNSIAATLDADLVINCSGAGDVRTTSSPLLRHLGAQLTAVATGRGFKLADDCSSQDWPGMYVAGPLLNGHELSSHVESISAVFKVAASIATSIMRALGRSDINPRTS
jgi:uncharacterized NAD(P)/FAD-binding protein YdhS